MRMSSKGFSLLKIVLSLLILLALLFFFSRDFGKVEFELDTTSFFLALIALLTSIAFRAYRWLLITNYYLSTSLSFWLSVRYLFIGSALNIILPSGAGDVLKGYVAEKEMKSSGAFVFSSLYDKLIAIASLSLLAAYSFYLSWSFIFVLAGVIAISPLILLHVFEGRDFKTLRLFKSIPKIKMMVSGLIERLAPPREMSLPLVVKSLALSFLGWLGTYFLLYMCFASVGLDTPLSYVLEKSPLLTLARLFPFTLNGIGTDEGLMIYLFEGMESAILTGALIYRGVLIFLPALVGLILMNIEKKNQLKSP